MRGWPTLIPSPVPLSLHLFFPLSLFFLLPSSLFPSFISPSLLSFLSSTYATNISKLLLCARQYAIKGSDSLKIAFILGWSKKEDGMHWGQLESQKRKLFSREAGRATYISSAPAISKRPVNWLDLKWISSSAWSWYLQHSSSRGLLLNIQCLRPQPRTAESQYLGIWPGNLQAQQTSQVSVLYPGICGSWVWALGSIWMGFTVLESEKILSHNSCVMRKGKRIAKWGLGPVLPLTYYVASAICPQPSLHDIYGL